MKKALLAILVCGHMFGQEPPQSAPAPPAPPAQLPQTTGAPKFPLSKEEEYHRQALEAKWNLIQSQINSAVQSHTQELNQFISDTLKAHGDPKNVSFDVKTYSFTVTEPTPGPVKPADAPHPVPASPTTPENPKPVPNH